jgi:hypothetical protein
MGTLAEPLNVQGRQDEPGDNGGRIGEQMIPAKMPASCGGSPLLEHQRAVCNQNWYHLQTGESVAGLQINALENEFVGAHKTICTISNLTTVFTAFLMKADK